MASQAEDNHVPETLTNGNKAAAIGHDEKLPIGKDTATNGFAEKQVSHDQDEGLQHGHSKPLQLKGVLDQFKSFNVTPTIGKEFPDANLVKWLRAPDSDELLRDPHNAVSQRGVVFFRTQNGFDDELQKELAQRLGELSGKPSSSKLHIHPVINAGRDHGGKDDEVSIISSVQNKKLYKGSLLDPSIKRQSGKEGWHSDITFEPVPSDYAILRLTQLPGTGGGTNKFPFLSCWHLTQRYATNPGLSGPRC